MPAATAAPSATAPAAPTATPAPIGRPVAAPAAAPSDASGGRTPRPFAEVIKDAKQIPGFLPIWQKDDRTWIEISPEQLDKPFFLSINMNRGIGERGLFAGRWEGGTPSAANTSGSFARPPPATSTCWQRTRHSSRAPVRRRALGQKQLFGQPARFGTDRERATPGTQIDPDRRQRAS